MNVQVVEFCNIWLTIDGDSNNLSNGAGIFSGAVTLAATGRDWAQHSGMASKWRRERRLLCRTFFCLMCLLKSSFANT